MLEYLGLIASIVCMLCSGLFFVCNYLVQQPMRIKLDGLDSRQGDMDKKLDEICKENKKEEVLIRGIEESAKSAHKRIDEHEERLRKVESRCTICQTCNRKE